MKKLFLIALLSCSHLAQAQLATDATAQQTVLKAIDHIYNFEFAEAEPYIRQLASKYPQSPVSATLRALMLQWQYFPLKEYPTMTSQFVQANQQAIALADKRLERDENDPEGVFFGLTAHGYMALKHNNDNEQLKAVGESKKAYNYLRKGFTLLDKFPEFYFSTGLYNYYVERYPLDHPIVRPLMIFFQDGNLALGLKQMEMAAKTAVFSRAEADYYLALIYLKYENQPAKAVIYARSLVDKFPKNPIYAIRYAESLLLAGRYAEARPAIQRLKQFNHRLLAMPGRVFDGLLLEKSDKNDADAAVAYQSAVRMPFSDPYTKEYMAMAYAGLARLTARTGNRNKAKSYYKKALNYGEYKSLIQEAKSF